MLLVIRADGVLDRILGKMKVVRSPLYLRVNKELPDRRLTLAKFKKSAGRSMAKIGY